MKIDRTSCLLPAAVQTGIMILFVLWSMLPETFLIRFGLPNNAALMPGFLFATLGIFTWNMFLWLRGIIRSKGKESSSFWIALLIILVDIAIMGYLMPPPPV